MYDASHDEQSGPARVEKTVAVVGLGKIGLPLAVQYALSGWRVIGCDINERVVATINVGRSHVQEEPELADALADLVRRGRLSATSETSEAVRAADVVVVIVPVGLHAEREVDFEHIDAATLAIGAGLQPRTLVIYETTLPVGTTARRFAPMLERMAHLKAERDFFLAYSPERVSSGHIFRDLRIYPKIVGGIDERSRDAAIAFYRAALDAEIITMASSDEAEFVKLIETTYRDVNIALANEFARFADARGIDVAAAIAAANTQPYSHIHAPGVGVGGHCIPVYPYFLLAGLHDGAMPDIDTPMLTLPKAARRINDAMAEYAIQRIEAINGPLAWSAALILGVTYRGNVHETAFTSAQLLQDALIRRGVTVYVDDPLYSEHELRMLGYEPLPADRADDIEAIILQAAHHEYLSFDLSRFVNCRVLLDGRRFLRPEAVEVQGIRYIAIGDGNSEPCGTQKGDMP